MKSPMLPQDHQIAVQRALVLGRAGDPAALPELVAMLRMPSHEVQRLAVSAIGKLAEFGADAAAAVTALAPLAAKARHPQTQQYKMSMYKKQTLYQQEGKRLVSVYPADLPRLDALLTAKLRLFGYGARSDVSEQPTLYIGSNHALCRFDMGGLAGLGRRPGGWPGQVLHGARRRRARHRRRRAPRLGRGR